LEVLEKYRVHLDAEGKKDSTKSSYLLDVGRLLRHFNGYKLSDITVEDIEAYCSELLKTCKASTVARMLSSTRIFWMYLIEQKICMVNPVQNVRLKSLVSAPEKIVPCVVVSRHSTMKDLRDKCIVALLSRTVIKQNELIEMNIDSVKIEKKQICLSGGRMIKIDKEMANVLRKYLAFLESVFMSPESPLFMNRNGGRLSRQGVWSIKKQAR